MINNIPELQVNLSKRADLFREPDFKKRFIIKSRFLTQNKIDFLLAQGMKLPLSYVNIIQSFEFNGIDIDVFDLSPYGKPGVDIIQSLLEAYEDPFFPKAFMSKHKMYQIGSYNTDILCITEGTDQFEEGEILYIDEGYDIYNPEDSQIHPIAKDFEQFIIIAGNLEQIHSEMAEDESNYEEKKIEFLNRLRALGVDKKYDNAWLRVF